MTELRTTVCVVGGGPGGLFLGLLLARRGIDVTVLEKHSDFIRDFRGDTVHPSTLDIFDELELGDAMRALPSRKAPRLQLGFDDGLYTLADFTRLGGRHNYMLFVPQWDLLDLLAGTAEKYPHFRLLRSTEAVDLLRERSGRVTGVRARDEEGGELRIEARLTVGADGRTSAVRRVLGLRPVRYDVPMDLLWFRLPKPAAGADGYALRGGGAGFMLVIDRGDYLQVAFFIPKGSADQVRAAGLDALRDRMVRLAPHLAESVRAVRSWDEVRLLHAKLDRLKTWHVPGALLIGDAAHAMSPIGGVGINLAVQDAIATARLLGPKLAAGTLTDRDLRRVARRRRLPTMAVQTLQRVAQQRLVRPIVTAAPRPADNLYAPRQLRLLKRIPPLQKGPARLIGRGIRTEHLGREHQGVPPGRRGSVP